MSLITDLPAIFDQFSEARQKGFLTVMDLKEQNVPLVGTYCTFNAPGDRAMAAGAVVVSLCSTSDETIEEAERSPAQPLPAYQKQLRLRAKPINVPTSISLTWWLGKPPATAKRKCMSTWPSSRRSTSCSCRTAPAMPPRAHCGKRRSCACSR